MSDEDRNHAAKPTREDSTRNAPEGDRARPQDRRQDAETLRLLMLRVLERRRRRTS